MLEFKVFFCAKVVAVIYSVSLKSFSAYSNYFKNCFYHQYTSNLILIQSPCYFFFQSDYGQQGY